MTDLKLCKDCKKFIGGECTDPQNIGPDLVNGGEAPKHSAHFQRQHHEYTIAPLYCGPSGYWWEAK